MGFLQLLRSIEELLYEIMAWLVFYPRTLGRVIRHPLQMLKYSERELGDASAEQYTDTLSPPLFLMLTILLAHGVELSFGQKVDAPTGVVGKLFANSEETMLLFRSVTFSIFPLMFAVAAVNRSEQDLDRSTLRRPFFSQCYLAALFALVISLLSTALAIGDRNTQMAAIIMIGLAVLIYVGLQAAWLKTRLPMGSIRASLVSLGTFLKATIVVMVVNSALIA
jgi:hypothetical protein